jgi:hypothetical protein
MTAELITKCFQVEALVRHLVLRGIDDREEIVARVDEHFEPETMEEMEAYSEAIIYARLGILN